MGYVPEGLTLGLGTFAHAQNVAKIRRCPKVSLAIDRDDDDWRQMQGLSLVCWWSIHMYRAKAERSAGEDSRYETRVIRKRAARRLQALAFREVD